MFCMQNSQLLTKSHAELQDNSIYALALASGFSNEMLVNVFSHGPGASMNLSDADGAS